MLTLITQILIASTAVLILAAMGLFVLRRKSVSMRHAWLCSIMVALIALPFLVPMLPVFAPIKKVEIAAESAPSVVPPTITQLDKQPELTEAVAAPVAVPLQQQIPENLPVEPVLTTVQTSVPEPVVQETSKNFNPAMILALILCTGTAIRLLTLLKSMAAMRRVAKNALVFKNGSDILNLTDIRKQFGVHRDIPVMTHDQVEVPFAAGIIRPMIFLPRVMQSESPDKLRLVLMHEMAHIARRDVFWQLLSRIMLAVNWFHPLAWWLASRIRREREFACDDAVLLANDRTVDTLDTPEDYAMVLLDISQSLRRKSVILPGCTVAMAQTHQMESRIRAILDDARTRKPIGRFAATLLIVCVCSLTAFAGMFSPFAVEEKINATVEKTEALAETGTLVVPPSQEMGDAIDNENITVIRYEICVVESVPGASEEKLITVVSQRITEVKEKTENFALTKDVIYEILKGLDQEGKVEIISRPTLAAEENSMTIVFVGDTKSNMLCSVVPEVVGNQIMTTLIWEKNYDPETRQSESVQNETLVSLQEDVPLIVGGMKRQFVNEPEKEYLLCLNAKIINSSEKPADADTSEENE